MIPAIIGKPYKISRINIKHLGIPLVFYTPHSGTFYITYIRQLLPLEGTYTFHLKINKSNAYTRPI